MLGRRRTVGTRDVPRFHIHSLDAGVRVETVDEFCKCVDAYAFVV